MSLIWRIVCSDQTQSRVFHTLNRCESTQILTRQQKRGHTSWKYFTFLPCLTIIDSWFSWCRDKMSLYLRSARYIIKIYLHTERGLRESKQNRRTSWKVMKNVTVKWSTLDLISSHTVLAVRWEYLGLQNTQATVVVQLQVMALCLFWMDY